MPAQRSVDRGYECPPTRLLLRRIPRPVGRWLGALILLAALAVHLPALAIEAGTRAAALNTITTEEVKKYVDALADDTFEGREGGSRGGRAAAQYIVENLKRMGLHGGGPKGSFLQEFRQFHNVLALVEGRDPELKDQVVVISAHYDHVGYGSASNSFGPTGHIHNGADDNASGVAALLEVAEAVSRLPEPTKRSILIAFWDGEEKGLLGSEHWANQPTLPLSRVSIMINADMVGRLRNGRVEVFGTRSSAGLRELVSRQNELPQLVLDFTWLMKPDSDHHTFYSRGIPILMMHTGMHGDYHRPSDDAEKINVEGLKQVAQLMFGTLVELADEPQLIGFRRQARSEGVADQQQRERPQATQPGRLGIRWNDDLATRTGQIVVTVVLPGSAAERAGLRQGDALVSLAGREVHGSDAFRLAILAAPAATTATVRRAGSEEPVELTLNLPGEPVRMGISWRVDDAEPGAVIVNRVTPGSPAALAGVRVNDRVYRVGGQDFFDAEGLRKLVAETSGPIELEIERQGRVGVARLPDIDAEITRLQAEILNRGTDGASN